MSIATALIITVIAIFFSGLFSGTEIAFVQSNKVRMEIDSARGGVINRIIQLFTRHEDMFISSLLVGNNAVLVIYGITISIIINPFLHRWLNNEALELISNTLISTLIILITGEFLPKTTFRINPNFTMRLIALPMFIIYIILYPLSLLVSLLSKGLMKIFGINSENTRSPLLTIDQIDDYLKESIDKGERRDEVDNEVKIFRNAVDFKDTQIADCMIPRNEIIAADIEETSREILIKRFIATGLSKIVIYRDDIDNVVGYIHISELFNPDADWKDHLKPVIYTPETMLANRMMRKMLSEKKSLAIVVDEFGGTSGLVTLEDLVEEIFGDIQDEHDKSRQLAKQLPDGTYEFSGRMEIDDINEQYGLDIPESDEYHTLAGYILEQLEALPAQGDVFDIETLRFTIKRMSATRIELIGVERIENED